MSLHDNAGLYVVRRDYSAGTGPYECHAKQWWIKASKHKVFQPRHGCLLEPLICGQAVFERIQRDIEAAQQTVDIVTWGFDPGMVLIRNGSAENGVRYGDLLKAVATRKQNPVLVRLLVWHDDIFSHLKMRNNPTYYGSRFPTIGASAGYLSEEHERFNAAWFDDVFAGRIPNIRLHVREVPLKYRSSSLAGEKYEVGVGGWFGSLYGTHHQKMVLIDYELPAKAVGYVMGHNSITDFWDTDAHTFRDPLREKLYRVNPKDMHNRMAELMDEASYFFVDRFKPDGQPRPTMRQQQEWKFVEKYGYVAKPYQDVSLRVTGPILYDLNFNFCEGWAESHVANSAVRHAMTVVEAVFPMVSIPAKVGTAFDVELDIDKKIENVVYKEPDLGFAERRRKLKASDFKLANGPHSAQLLRTQPMHGEKGIKECYANLTRQLEHYIFLQNQYIQYEEWATYLKECVNRLRQHGYTRPTYVFILTSTPESTGMDLPTYGVAKRLGQSESMMVEHAEAVAAAKRGEHVDIITVDMLQAADLYVVMGSLWNCAEAPTRAEDYEEVYIHAKVAIVDDAAFTVGSANLNVRSMALDSELNLLSQAADVAVTLRKTLFKQCSNESGPSQFGDMFTTYRQWTKLGGQNLLAMQRGMPLEGQLVSFHVDRKPGTPVI